MREVDLLSRDDPGVLESDGRGYLHTKIMTKHTKFDISHAWPHF